MGKHYVLRMRRELAGPIEPPIWPAGATIRTLAPKPERKEARAAHSVLEAGFWEGGGGAPVFPRWWKALRKDKEFDPSLVFIVYVEKEVVGMAQCWTSAFIKDIAVHPRFRRHGIGRALILTTFDAFQQRGAPHVDLKVREENETAQRLYTSLRMRIVTRDAE